MIHEIIPVGPLQCNCSIIGDESTHDAMVIDPGDNIAGVLAIVRKHKLIVKQIVVTHAHIDHVGGATKLKQATGAPILLNQNDYALLKMLPVQAAWIGVAAPEAVTIDQPLADADTVRAGNLSAMVAARHAWRVERRSRGPGAIGRTDLPGGSFPNIMRSLHERVLALPDETVVVPGHGPTTTIGEERESNPFLLGKY